MSENLVNVQVEISDQEKEWVKMLCEGEKLTKIATSVGINKNTLAYKLGNLRDRLGCKNTVELAAYFFRNNLIS